MNKDNIIVALIEGLCKIGVAFFIGIGIYGAADMVRKDHQEQLNRIDPMMNELTDTVKTSNRYMKLMVDKGFREEQDLYKE